MREGVKVKIGEQEYVVPRLTVREFRTVSRLTAPEGVDGPVDLLLEQIAAVLRLNYPEITATALEGSVCFGDLLDTHAAVLAAAGAKRRAEGEAVSP